MSSFDPPSETLASCWSSLQAQWAQSRAEWNDAVAARFEREYWNEWEALLPAAINTLRELEEAIEASRADWDRE